MSFLRALCLAALLLANWPVAVSPAAAAAQATNITCPGQPTSLRRAVTNGNQPVACYTIALGKGSASLRLDFAANSGIYDLYIKAGTAKSFTNADKINLQAIKGRFNYILANARSSTYTVGVARTGRSGTFNLSSPAASGVSSSCVAKTCRALSPLVIGGKAGDQALYRVDIAANGAADAQISWQPAATKLSAAMNGSRASGAQPLKLKANVVKGRPLSLLITNGGGNVSGGQVNISYPR